MIEKPRPTDDDLFKDMLDSVKLAADTTYSNEHAARLILNNLLAFFRTRGMTHEIMQIAMEQAKRESAPVMAYAETPAPSGPVTRAPQPWMNLVQRPFKTTP